MIWNAQKTTSTWGIVSSKPLIIAVPRSVTTVNFPLSCDSHWHKEVLLSCLHTKAVLSAVSPPIQVPSCFHDAKIPGHRRSACQSIYPYIWRRQAAIPTAKGTMVPFPNRASIIIALPSYHLNQLTSHPSQRQGNGRTYECVIWQKSWPSIRSPHASTRRRMVPLARKTPVNEFPIQVFTGGSNDDAEPGFSWQYRSNHLESTWKDSLYFTQGPRSTTVRARATLLIVDSIPRVMVKSALNCFTVGRKCRVQPPISPREEWTRCRK